MCKDYRLYTLDLVERLGLKLCNPMELIDMKVLGLGSNYETRGVRL